MITREAPEVITKETPPQVIAKEKPAVAMKQTPEVITNPPVAKKQIAEVITKPAPPVAKKQVAAATTKPNSQVASKARTFEPVRPIARYNFKTWMADRNRCRSSRIIIPIKSSIHWARQIDISILNYRVPRLSRRNAPMRTRARCAGMPSRKPCSPPG